MNQIQREILSDLKQHKTGTAKTISDRIKRFKKPVEHHLAKLETSGKVRKIDQNTYTLTN